MGFTQGRVPTLTRTVIQFGELEHKLADASTREPRAALLTDDFEERLCSAPGTPIPREDWLAREPTASAKLSQQAVHLYDDVAVYSAMLSRSAAEDTIVDVWHLVEGNWKLAVRFRCPANGPKPAKSAVPKRY
jgi:hypothetical protein